MPGYLFSLALLEFKLVGLGGYLFIMRFMMTRILPETLQRQGTFSSSVVVGLSMLAGVLGFFSLPVLPSGSVYAVVVGVLLGFAALYLPLLRPVFFAAIGFGIAWLNALDYQRHVLPSLHENKLATIIGVVEDIPQHQPGMTRFTLLPDSVSINNQSVNLGRIRLAYYGTPNTPIRAGAQIRFNAKLKRPHGFVNPGAFDYERWLFHHRITASGYVKSDIEVLSSNHHTISVWRHQIADHIDFFIHNLEISALTKALLIGHRSNLNDHHWDVLQHTGTAHLLAISGLHLGLVAAGVFFVTRRLMLRIEPSGRGESIVWGITLIVCVIYSLLAGFSIPTQRALFMLVILAVMRQSGRHNPFTPLFLTLTLCLLWEPFMVLTAGFWLSFFAVLLILLTLYRYPIRHAFLVLLTIQLVLSLGLIPILSVFSLPVSVISIIANLIMVPLVSFVIMPFVLLSGISLVFPESVSSIFFALSEYTLTYAWDFLNWLSQHTPKPWRLHLSPGQGISATFGIIFLLLPRALLLWPAAGILLISAFTPLPRPLIHDKTVRVTLLDIGQGLSVLIETRHHTLLYDTGPRYRSGDTVFNSVIRHVLDAKQIQSLDELIISHDDSDHSGGLKDALNHLAVKTLRANPPIRSTTPCQYGQHWNYDGVEFTILHPLATTTYQADNNSSCVLQIRTGQQRILLTGDIEASVEHELIERNPTLQTNILLLPHHGSKTSSTTEFLTAVKPDYAISSNGYQRRYFPHKSVLARLKQRHIPLIDTATYGATVVTANPKKITITPFRQHSELMWHRFFLTNTDK
jgi:competence protein ComEC